MSIERNLVIGLGGYAGSGKDLFFSLLSQHIQIERYALADELKLDMREQLMRNHDVDIFDCTKEEKDSVRHLLVSYGSEKRKNTNGRYWIDKLNEKLLPITKDICVTDIRYANFNNDEANWLKDELGGMLVWVDQYNIDPFGGKIYNSAPNGEEAENGPKLRERADYIVDWPYESNKENLNIYIDNFLEWLNTEWRERIPINS